ncbi:MAG: hypothetical protein IIA72_17335 [Proteobacteria bacterium]|nr:hypothetical protein [Pseudomonadota bacterium]
MLPKHVLLLAVCTILLVFLFAAGWEFLLRDTVQQSGVANGAGDSARLHWEHIIASTIGAGLAVGILSLASLRIITQRNRANRKLQEACNTLKERPAQLEEENAQRNQVEQELLGSQKYLDDQNRRLEELAQSLAQARERAEVANQAKSAFLAIMSHELRTPLNAIIGFSEIIKNESFGPGGSTKYRDYAGDIHRAGQHLLDLVNDILDLSRIESGADELHQENVDIPETVRSIMRLVKVQAQTANVELESDVPDDVPALRADQRKVKQILVNLLSNAIKFTPGGGKVTLRIRYRSQSGYVFQVIDSGIGIAFEDIPKALAPFQQVDSGLNRKHEGTGLGLPLTNALVELHGGSLDLQSEVGVGTTVTVRFPAERIGSEAATGMPLPSVQTARATRQ